MEYTPLQPFPPAPSEYETPEVLRALGDARAQLAELKGLAQTIPNERILIAALGGQEAQSSSAIENIHTTQEALHEYRASPGKSTAATKEAAQYADAMEVGWREMHKHNLLSCNTIIRIQQILTGRATRWREQTGTVIKDGGGKVVFTPPPPDKVPALMAELEQYMHDDAAGVNPIVRMALIHPRFETIHPFYDGNGRTGRIINILFLVKAGLLKAPFLYLSRYINQTRPDYYRLLRHLQDGGDWQPWLLYMLRGVAATAKNTITLVEQIRDLHTAHKKHIKSKHYYSRELLDLIFTEPYTTAARMAKALGVSRATARRYLDGLDLLMKINQGRENYYYNIQLMALLANPPDMEL